MAARIAAGQMVDLVRYGTGMQLFEIAIAQALGETVDDDLVTPAFVRPVVIRFLTARPGVLPVGTVATINGLDRVRTAPGGARGEPLFRRRHDDRAAPGRCRQTWLRDRHVGHPRGCTATRRRGVDAPRGAHVTAARERQTRIEDR